MIFSADANLGDNTTGNGEINVQNYICVCANHFYVNYYYLYDFTDLRLKE